MKRRNNQKINNKNQHDEADFWYLGFRTFLFDKLIHDIDFIIVTICAFVKMLSLYLKNMGIETT